MDKNSASRTLRVLVVEDDVDTAETLAILLKQWGFTSQTVHDGARAMQSAAELRPDAVLLDLGLPKINGLEVARQLRERFGHDLLIIAVTGRSQPLDQVASKAAGIDLHLAKPADPLAVRDALEQFKQRSLPTTVAAS